MQPNASQPAHSIHIRVTFNAVTRYSLFAAHENLPERAIKSFAPLRITQTLRERCMRENVEKITLTRPDGGCQSEAIINY